MSKLPDDARAPLKELPVNSHVDSLMGRQAYERSSADLSASSSRRNLIDFSLNINPLGLPSGSAEAARMALQSGNRYPDMDLMDLRKDLARHHGVPASMLLFGCGLDEILRLIIAGWVNVGSTVVTHLPTFPRYEIETIAHGAIFHGVQSPDLEEISVQQISEAITKTGAELVFICSPNNPTGIAVSPDDVAHLAEAHSRTQFVVDEAMIFPLDAGSIPLVTVLKNVAVLRTFSKYYGLAGFRVGYMLAHSERLAVLEAIRPPFNVTTAAASAAQAALREPQFLTRSREVFDQLRQEFESRLAAVPGIRMYGHASNMLLLDFPDLSDTPVEQLLVDRGFVVASGHGFSGLESSSMIRVSLQSSGENMQLADTLIELIV